MYMSKGKWVIVTDRSVPGNRRFAAY